MWILRRIIGAVVNEYNSRNACVSWLSIAALECSSRAGRPEWRELVGDCHFAVGESFGLGDIAAATVLGYMSVRWPEMKWREQYPNLAGYSDRMEQRPSLQSTRPVPQKISDKIV